MLWSETWPNCCSNYRVNTLRPRINDRHFADDISKCFSMKENFWILNKIQLKYVPCGIFHNMAALVQIMGWRRSGDKPLSEPMAGRFTGAYMRHSMGYTIERNEKPVDIYHRFHANTDECLYQSDVTIGCHCVLFADIFLENQRT